MIRKKPTLRFVNTESPFDQNVVLGKFSHKHGTASFYGRMLPGSCAVAILHDFSFNFSNKTTKKQRENFYRDLHAALYKTTTFQVDRSKLLVVAVSPSDLDDFVNTNEWEGDSEFENAKSGNLVRIWSFNRGVRSN